MYRLKEDKPPYQAIVQHRVLLFLTEKSFLPMIRSVTHAIQYGTTVTVQGIKDLILLALSLL